MKKIHIFFAVILLIVISGCLKEDEMKKPYTGFMPVNIEDGWVISVPSVENIDSIMLDQVYKDVYADDGAWMMKSLLVFRHGKLVAESYLKDEADRTKADAIFSCTKQVTGIVTGIALHEGYIESVDDLVSDYYPQYIADNPEKASLILEHLLMMKSGTTFENGVFPDILRQQTEDDIIGTILGMDLAHEPGEYFKYNDGDPQIISGIVGLATGKPLDEYAKEVLLDPLGINNFKWERYSEGLTLGAIGILTTGREMAKIAQCVLDSGRYQNRQIIPEAWLEEMLSAKVTGLHDGLSFGYEWWGQVEKGYHFMAGHGGQYAFLVPAKDLLVVITSYPQVDDDVAMPTDDVMELVDRIAATAN
jgi:CubicO group peptidase (beta-lactamase class C family)